MKITTKDQLRRAVCGVVLIAGTALLGGCKGRPQQPGAPSDRKLFQSQERSRFEQLTPYGRRELDETVREKSDECRFQLGDCRQQLRAFYASLAGSLGWIRGAKPTRQAMAAIGVLKNAEDSGLHSDDYEGSLWDERLGQSGSMRNEGDAIDFDVALTKAVMTYLSDLHGGRLNPHQYHAKLDVDHRDFDLSDFAWNLVRSQSVADDMRAVEPPVPAYKRAAAALRKYRELEASDDAQRLPNPRRTLVAGQSYPDMPRVRRLLAALGDLPNTASQNGAAQNDGQAAQQADENVFTREDKEAVRRFQSRHGLEANGRLDQATVAELNIPLHQRVEQLSLTLERWRWLPHELPEPPIIVNIPAFSLRAENDKNEAELAMKVVVGDAFDHKTPVFASQLSTVVLRPEWDVPASITKDEIVEHIERDPGYLAKNNYEVVGKNGNAEDGGRLSRRQIAALEDGKLRLRQKAGPGNALGLIKFEFPNPYAVYLHGTPATQAFARQRRDLSHGCIRVEDPARLAAWVLRDNPEWNADKISSEAETGDMTVRIKTSPASIMILYMTAEADEDGTVRFYRDIYGDDAVLQNSLITRSGPAETPRTPAQGN